MSEPENIAIFANFTLIKNSKKEVVIRNKIKRVDIDKFMKGIGPNLIEKILF